MKKNLIFGSLLVLSTALFSQTWGGSQYQHSVTYRSGHVGIGTSANNLFPVTYPNQKLEVFTEAGEGLGVTETSSNGMASFILRHAAPSANTFEWHLNNTNTGNFTLVNWTRANTDFFIDGPTGKVSIGGNVSPNASLHIGDGTGNLHFGSKGVLIKFASGDRSLMELHTPDASTKLIIQSHTGGSYVTNLGAQNLYLQTGGGKVLIGNGAPKVGSYVQNAKLTVDGMVFAKEFFVAVSNTYWADYVFDKDYKLMPLNKVKQFIEKEKHLPNIPSGIELEENGLSIAEMQKNQMEKIEELYLYVILLNEKIDALKKENEELKTKSK